MKRSTESRASAGDLPGFLGEASASAESEASAAATRHDELEFEQEEQEVDADAYGDDDDEQHYDDSEEPVDDYVDDDDELAEQPARGRRSGYSSAYSSRRRARQAANTGSAGGGFAVAMGLVVVIVATVATFVPKVNTMLQEVGLPPQTLMLLGAIVFVVGIVQRGVGTVQRRIDQADADRRLADEELRSSMSNLADDSGRAQADEGELQHVLLSLQRQDQKINNLTKAIKMYGKPLMEIAGQCTEIAGGIGQVRTLVETGNESNRVATNRLEEKMRQAGGKTDLGELPQQVSRLEVTLAAVTQRLENSDVQKSLVRLEDATQQARAEVQQLLSGDGLREATGEMQAHFENATKGLAAGIEQMRAGNLSDLEAAVREIQREVAGLATSVAQIQAAVKSGVRTAAPAPAAAAPSASRSAAAGSTSPAPAAGGSGADGDDANGYQTGKRKTGGKNVLGAIAKLKAMKG